VRLRIAWIGKTRESAIQSLTAEYLKRIGRYIPTESHELRNEQALLDLIANERTRPYVVLLDSRGKQVSSEELAGFMRDHQDRGTQTMLLAIGPADGFSETTRRAASFTLSFGKMTLAHELARVVLLEQVYRAFTIIKGHPYHSGH
jgi:23S rRNA (pseudouridine1915-N3)-methyltransferase